MTQASGPDSKREYAFGQIAIRENLCTFEQVKECLDVQSKLRSIGTVPKKLGEILIEKGYLTPEQAVQITQLQIQAVSSPRLAIPGYEILSRIGRGAMGTVYKARQLSIDRIVAVKVLATKYSEDRAFVDRFLREARAVAKLHHPNIISGIDVGEAGGTHYFVMEFVDGSPLTSLMRGGSWIEEKRCVRIGIQIAGALAHAHRHGILHRDVKPENIMIDREDVAKLCDLGLAKQAKGDTALTMDGSIVGTPNYLSPEQARGDENIDGRADIYSLGVSLYHMATGVTPFSGPNPMVVMTKHVTEQPEPPRKRNPSLSPGFNNIILMAMQKHPEARYRKADEMGADLERLLEGGTIHAPSTVRRMAAATKASNEPALPSNAARPRTVHHRLTRARSGSPTRSVFIVVGLMAVAGIGLFLASRGSPPPEEPLVSAPMPPFLSGGEGSGNLPQREIEAFRKYSEHRMANDADPHRFTEPYEQVANLIDRCRAESRFQDQIAWEAELGAYRDRVNALVREKVWAKIEEKAEEHLAAGRYAQALQELSGLQDVYRYFRRGPDSVLTEAGQAHAGLVRKTNEVLGITFVTQVESARRTFDDLASRDEAYRILTALASTATADQKGGIEQIRTDFFRKDIARIHGEAPVLGQFARARDRIQELRILHAGNDDALRALDALEEGLAGRQKKVIADGASQAALAYAREFQPRFAESLRQRDVVAARAALHGIFFSGAMASLLPERLDGGLLRACLDPERGSFPRLKEAVRLAEEGTTATGKDGQKIVRELFLDLREALLLEEILEQALQGARISARETNPFKTGYSAILRNARSVEPLPRGPGEGIALGLKTAQDAGRALQPVWLSPRRDPALTEDDIVALARWATGDAADRDPRFALKAFLLYYHAMKYSHAKGMAEKVTQDLRIGFERYAPMLMGSASIQQEKEAEALYLEAADLYAKSKRLDEKTSFKKFRELVDKYGKTEYIKGKGPTSTRSRLEILREILGEGRSEGVARVFGTSDVRKIGDSRYDVTYAFKDDRELVCFTTSAGGAVKAVREAAVGARLSGAGFWYWNAPLQGNVTFEVSFRMETEGSLGFVLHGEANRAGYLALLDATHMGVKGGDLLARMPISGGPQAASSVLVWATGDFALPRREFALSRFTRMGTELRFALNGGMLLAKDDLLSQGRVGLALGPPEVTVAIERIRIVGEVDADWLDTELKR